MSKLVSYVHMEGPSGLVAFGPDDDVPEWAARKMGAHCFEDGEHPFPDEPEEPSDSDGPPAKAGPKSSKEAWAAYAEQVGVDVSGAGSRDEIITAVSAAGHPVE